MKEGTQLGFIHLAGLQHPALLDKVEIQQGQSVAWCCFRKGKYVKLPAVLSSLQASQASQKAGKASYQMASHLITVGCNLLQLCVTDEI